jgi:tetrahydromethanopterin S-methyltransferase subunit A
VGETILALVNNGVDERRRIIGTKAPTAYLFNIQPEFVERFRKQITVIDLINEGSPEILREAVCSCYQEQPTVFRNYRLCDPGAYPEPPLSGKITWRVKDPYREPKSQDERQAADKIRALSERIRRSVEEKKRQETKVCPDNPPGKK